MRSEKDLMLECKRYFKGDTDAYIKYLKGKVDENLLKNNLISAKIFLEDFVSFGYILERQKNDRNKSR